MRAPGILSIDRVTLAVRDLAAAEATYGAILGRIPSWRGAHTDQGAESLLYRLPNATLELRAASDAAARPDWLGPTGEGVIELSFVVADASQAAQALRERGLPAGDPLSGESRERRWRQLSIPFSATSGLPIVLIEPMSPPLVPAPLRDGVDEVAAADGLHFLVLLTRDGDAIRLLFGEQLGLRVALDRGGAKSPVRQLYFETGDAKLEVINPLDPAKAPKSDRYWGLAWDMRDVAAARERLARGGADVSEVRIGREPGTRVATVRGEPCGVPTLLVDGLAARGLG